MATFTVVLRRRWFGEEMEQKLSEYDHLPEPAELLDLARRNHLGAAATLYILPARSKNAVRQYKVRDLQAG